MNEQRRIKVGLVGTGYAARKRAEAFCSDERSQLTLVTGHNLELTTAFCQTYSSTAIDSWQQLVSEQIDLVVICTINCDHGRIAYAALQAGKHVVIEYPLALNANEAQNLINLAKNKGKLLHVEHIELLGGVHQTIRQYLPTIGNIFSARYITISPKHPAPHRWTYNHDLYGFPLKAALSRIHRLTDLFGKVASVSCQARFWDLPDSPYYTACLCNAQLRFHNGLIAEISYGKGDKFWQGRRTFEVYGDQGLITFEGQKGMLIRGEEKMPLEVGIRRGSFAQDTSMVLNHLLEGKPLYVEPKASLYGLKVADAACLSAQTGKTVDLI